MNNVFPHWGARIWKSTLLVAFFSTVVRGGAQFFLLPAVLFYLSPGDQAMWWVFVALGNFANLADFGFGQVISRVYNFLWAGADDFDAEGLRPPAKSGQPNLPRLRTLNCTVRHLYLRLSLVAMLLLAVGGTLYLLKAINENAHSRNLWFLWAIYLLAVTFNFGSSHWLLACQGIDRMRQVHLAYLTSGLVYLAVAFCFLKFGLGLAAMVAATLARGVALWIMGRASFCSVISLKDGPAQPDFTMLRRLWPNASKFGILSLGGYLLANGTVLISRYFLGVEITASVGLTNQIGAFVVNFASLWLNVKWPQITILRTQGRLEQMALLFARRLVLVMGSFVFLGAFIIITGNPLLEWKHYNTRLLPLPYLIVYFLYLGQNLFYVQFGILTFTENVVPFFKIGLFTGLAMIALSLILTPMFGLWGLILAPLIAETTYSAWFTVRRGFSGQPLNCSQFVWAAILGHP